MKKPKAKTRAKPPVPMSPEHLRLMEEYAGQGVSTRRRDYMHPEREGDEWIGALFELEDGDREPLLRLLKSNEPLPQEFRRWIAYIVDRYRLVTRRGKGRLSAPYAITDAELRLRDADEDIRYLINKGMPASKAQEVVALRHRLDEEKIATHRRGSRGSTRRMHARKGR